MLKQTKGFILGFITCALLFALAVTVFAAPIYKTVEIVYNNIKINIDGKEITPKDASGNIVEPFNYNGTVYLPVRAIGEALEKDVSWDGNSQTVFLKNKATSVDTAPAIQTKTFEGRLEKSDSVNTYNFTLPYNSRVTISVEHEFFNDGGAFWIVQIMTKSGIITEFRSQGNVIDTNLDYALYLPAGEYIIRVAPNYHSNKDYKINIRYEKNIGQYELEYNNDSQSATEIQLNKAIKGNIYPHNDVDFYKINITSKKEISVKFEHEFFNDGGAFWIIQIMDKNGIITEFRSQGNVIETFSDKITLPETGYYYITVKANYHSAMDYTLMVIG